MSFSPIAWLFAFLMGCEGLMVINQASIITNTVHHNIQPEAGNTHSLKKNKYVCLPVNMKRSPGQGVPHITGKEYGVLLTGRRLVFLFKTCRIKTEFVLRVYCGF